MRKAVVIALLMFQWILAQQNTVMMPDGVQLIDFHYSDITDVTYVESRDEIYSSDSSGKIIVYNGTTQKYKFTFQKADGVAVRKMQLLNKNRLVLLKAYATMDGTEPDSLLAFDLHNKQRLNSQEFNGTLLGNDIDAYTSLGISKGHEHGLVIMKRDPVESVATVMSKAPAVTASVSTNGEQIAFVESQYGQASFVVKAANNTELFREDLSDLIGTINSFKVIYEDAGSILLCINNTSSDTISIYRYSNDFGKQQVQKLEGKPGFKLIVESIIRNGKKEFILGTNTNSFQNEYLMGFMNDGMYSMELFKTDKNFSYAYLADESNEVSFFSLWNDTSNLNKPITRFNIIRNKKIDFDNTQAFGDYRGLFLASGDLLFIGRAGNENEEIKLFTAGTLQNKYAPLSAREYFKRNHELDLYDYYFLEEQIDPLSSSMAVLADYKGKKRIVSYNFTSEQVSKLSEDVTDGYTSVVSYHGKTSQVLLSKGNYKHGGGYENPGSLKWCVAGDCNMIYGVFKQGQFSRDGKFLLTINDKNLIELRALPSLKILTQKQIDKTPQIDLNYSDDNEFEISLNYGYALEGCYLKHISLVINGSNYDFQERDCLGVIDSEFQNGTQAALLNFVGIIVGDQLYDIDKSVDAKSLSLNNDGTKLLVNYKHGLIELFDVASKQKELSIIQPDYDSHLFVDRSGHYISNFKADDLVTSYQNGKKVSLNVVKSKFYKPSIVLEKIGEVDADYATTLAKAEQIRGQFTAQDDNLAVQVSNFKLKEGSLNETQELVNNFTFQAIGLDKNTTQVYLNGVEVQEAKITDEGSNNYKFEIELAALENIIELRTETGTVLASKTIAYIGTDLNPNLYVLAVGVSDYEQAQYNLTFAAKDAMDIAQLYGNLSEKEIIKYENEYYSKPLYLTDKDGNQIGQKIKFYLDGFDPLRAHAVSADGYYWVSDQKLFDFKTGTVTELDSNEFEVGSYSAVGDSFIVDPSNKGFYYQKEEQIKYYDFKLETSEVASLPFERNALFSYDPIRLLTDDLWLQSDSGSFTREDSYGGKLTLTYSNQKEVVKTQTIEIADQYNLSVEAVNVNGEFILIKDIDGNYYFYDLSANQPLLVSTSKIKNTETTDEFYISNTGSSIIRFKDGYPESERVTQIDFYNNDLELIETKGIDIAVELGITNVVINDTGVKLLKRSTSKASSRGFMGNKLIEDVIKERSATAASFNNTEVTYLLNDNATKKNILKELKSLQKLVRPQDQVVVFIAGHGVLDKELNYYYAPNDMDFENVTKKGVSFNEIIQGLNDTSSTKMLLLMDTCHSGNTLDMDNYEIVEESVADKDGRKKRGGVAATTSNNGDKTTVSQVVSTLFDNFTSVSGVTVISASSGQDVAYESEELSNGAFTTAYISYLQEMLGQDFLNKADYTKPLNLSDDFIKELRKRILDYTSNKQQLDIREINELSKIKLW